jgi:arsenate reductase
VSCGEIGLYGIETCDQVRKARQWLKIHGVAFRYHDFRREGVSADLLAGWFGRVPWDALVNRKGLTWRRLGPSRRAAVTDQASATELMLAEPTVIKRPVLQANDRLMVGFSQAVYASLLD